MAKKIEVPSHLWCEFIDVMFSAIKNIEPTKENAECMAFIKTEVYKAVEEGDILVVDGKLVDKEKYLKEEVHVN